jgi:hypothetical protein
MRSLTGMTGTLSADASAAVAGLAIAPAPSASADETDSTSVITQTVINYSTASSSSSAGPSKASNIFADAPSATSGAEHQTVGLSVIFLACIITLWLVD